MLIKGVLTALIVPCGEDGRVSLAALEQLVDFQIEAGVHGLFILGTAGQGPMLTESERISVMRHVLQVAHGRLKIVVHVGAMPTSVAQSLAEQALGAGASALSAIPPTYYQPDFIAIENYYRDLRSVCGSVPLLAYNNPAATGVDLKPHQLESLYQSGLIAGVKQANASLAELHQLIRSGVPVWVANANLNLAGLMMGSLGSISTITNVLPEVFVSLYNSVQQGKVDDARSWQNRIDLGAAVLRSPIIGALHAGCTLRGLLGLAPRPPLRLPNSDELMAIQRGIDTALGQVHRV